MFYFIKKWNSITKSAWLYLLIQFNHYEYYYTNVKKIISLLFFDKCYYKNYDKEDIKIYTNSSSPLGQLFDHGLDGISWTVWSLSFVSLLGWGLSYEGILCMLGTWTPLYLTHLLEYYTGVFEYTIGNIDGTTGILITIFLHLLPAFFGRNFYDIKLKDAFWFIPEFITREFIFRDLALLFVVYVGVILSLITFYYLFKAQKDKKTTFVLILQVAQNLFSYVILISFNTKIDFVRDNIGLFYILVTLIYNIVLVKLVVCLMAKMSFLPIHLEYLTFLIYFYFQSKYDGSIESENNVRYAFYVTFGILSFLYLRLFQSCITQLTSYLDIYCFSIEKKVKSD